MNNSSSNRRQGFTFVELVIAIAIVGILAAIAYPAYVKQVLKSHRADAISTLAQQQAILDRCYAQNFTYQGCPGISANPVSSSSGYYSISISNQTASTYMLTATATGGQAADKTCTKFTIDQSNSQGGYDSGNLPQAECWHP